MRPREARPRTERRTAVPPKLIRCARLSGLCRGSRPRRDIAAALTAGRGVENVRVDAAGRTWASPTWPTSATHDLNRAAARTPGRDLTGSEDLGQERPRALLARRAEELGRGPGSTMTPPSMKTAVSATSRAKPISWVTTIIVMPSSREAAHHVEHLADELGVERRGRLVEEHELRAPSPARGRSRRAAAGRRRAAPGRRRPCRRGRPDRAARAAALAAPSRVLPLDAGPAPR